jgi:hypothetical protein
MDRAEAKRITEKTYQDYKDKPDAHVERKIGVVRSLIVNAQLSGEDISYNEARMAGLDHVVHERERRKRGRERRDEIKGWSAEARGWVAVTTAAVGAGLIGPFWKPLAKLLGLWPWPLMCPCGALEDSRRGSLARPCVSKLDWRPLAEPTQAALR